MKIKDFPKMFEKHILEWSATFLAVIGSLINAFRYIEGFYFWTVANIFWMVFAIKHKHWGLFTMMFIFTIINIIGIYRWSALG